MRKLWNGVVRAVFWSYERGTWPYDLMVIAIVAFVLLTPRKWFHDQMQPGEIAASDVRLVSEDGSNPRIYRIEAEVLPPNKRSSKPTPELEREIHDVLGRTVGDLKGRTFQVRAIDAARAEDGNVLYYTVTVQE
jgi:hypothetical protein